MGFGNDAQGDTLIDIEKVIGSDFSDVLIGGHQLWGGGGNDQIYGSDQDNTYLNGGDGDDKIIAGANDDDIYAGEGADYVEGGAGDDEIFVNDGNDTVLGGSGNDLISGGDDIDTLDGGDDADILDGGNGDDILLGGDGDDLLAGGLGYDDMTGGSGADTFVFGLPGEGSPTDLLLGIIRDFNLAGDDKIDLSGFDAFTATPGIEPFHFIGTDEFSGIVGELRYGYSQDGLKTAIMGDRDANGAADFIIELDGIYTLDENDFIL